jgi:polyhydroxybutyrate depolymerase
LFLVLWLLIAALSPTTVSAQANLSVVLGNLLGPLSPDYVKPYDNMQAQRITLRHAGEVRNVLILKPVQARFASAPAIVLLHYRGGNGTKMANLTEVGALVRDHGVWIILPDAINGSWQDNPFETVVNDNDVGFLDALIGHSIASYGLDRRRIYMAGYSDGGFMTIRFACEHAERLAGAFTVGAAMVKRIGDGCTPSKPMPFAFVNGTRDLNVRYKGSFGVLSAPQTAAKWAALNACIASGPEIALPDLVPDGTRVRMLPYRACAEPSAVDFYTVDNGGHTWPEIGRAHV